ncbi:MAG: glycosyltransferase [Pseudomonadota bacterium]
MPGTPYLSVCIPCYAMGGLGAQFLRQSLDVLAAQSFDSFEVIVTDQSDDTDIRDLCAEYRSLNLRHLPTGHLKRQASANTNAAFDAAKGEVVKVLFQDDFLNGTDALDQTARAFEGADWCLTGSLHTLDGTQLIRPMIPRYHNRIHFGENTVSSPSVLAVRREGAPRFDENLVWLMDVDLYKRCADQWGEPAILPEPLVVNRMHAGQVSAGVGRGLHRRELRYVQEKYANDMTWRDWVYYLGRMRRTFF